MKTKSLFFLIALAIVIFYGCKKEVEKNSLTVQIPESIGAYCKYGGYKIISGVDQNSNNILDSNEIQQTEYVCKGIDEKETIIYFPGQDYGYLSNNASGSMWPRVAIANFDISNYPADSISFSAYLYSNMEGVKAFVELYDQTNNKVIKNAILSTTSTKSDSLYSTTVNFLNDLPKGPIKLNCRLRTEKDGTGVTFRKPMLNLYKK
ncbi:hypothetical protein A4D02_30720 [Niastella koreensis]|uniref:DUF7151 domain-containing protein n=2 Tax=Niastella koreensis TaxID=354356 RepID=G8THQ4_NIAKG|nr:hypothetical protein [Niastella koreensis]AEV97482.1 hypothetical protein Niako_1107 [Niastella koreensis GR20-10]OQP47698.1 hypothetical protein A4D02_30720 [Niastella koreensis]